MFKDNAKSINMNEFFIEYSISRHPETLDIQYSIKNSFIFIDFALSLNIRD